jgi:hypothetical protein
MARGVCEDDPRTLAQHRADALGALARGWHPRTPPSLRCDARPPLVLGGGPVPAPLLAQFIARARRSR